MAEMREPNEEEKEDLVDYFVRKGQTREDARALLECYYFGVIDDFTSDCPGYAGKIVFAVYGHPGLFEVYVYEDGQLVRQESEREEVLASKLESARSKLESDQ